MTNADRRAELRRLMDATVRQEPYWHYRQYRPYVRYARLSTPVSLDCSAGCATLCRWADVPDPTGYGHTGYGNTVSMYQHLPHIPVSEAQVGDLIVYGYGGADHVVMVHTPGSDPLVWSHGQERGPILVRHSVEDRFHSGPSTALRVMPLEPTRHRVLPRRKAPSKVPGWWWDWAAWKLGDRKGPRPKSAPRRIPLWAWIKLRAFKKVRDKQRIATG